MKTPEKSGSSKTGEKDTNKQSTPGSQAKKGTGNDSPEKKGAGKAR